jgi:hypothetical protein
LTSLASPLSSRFVIGLSVWKSRRVRGHTENSADFFLAGRGLAWPLIGISIVAANISTEQMVGMAGQAAGDVGLGVSAWHLSGSVGIVMIAMTLLPRFLRAGIYTMPEFLEYRYNAAARSIMAILTVIIYTTGGAAGGALFGRRDPRASGRPALAVWVIGLIGPVRHLGRAQGHRLGGPVPGPGAAWRRVPGLRLWA